MIDSLHNVDLNFLTELSSGDLAVPVFMITTHKGTDVNVPIIFGRMSAKNLSEDKKESYPKLSVQNYPPTLNEQLFNDRPQWRFAPERTEETLIAGYLYWDFFPLAMKYDVSFACKSESEWDAAKLYFMAAHVKRASNHFKFNKIVAGTDAVYDPVGYDMTATDVFRTDGVFETTFEFTLYPWVVLTVSEPVVIVSELTFALNQTITTMEKERNRVVVGNIGTKVTELP